MRTLYTNAMVLGENGPETRAFVVENGRFSYVGSQSGAREVAGPDADQVDLGARFVSPGIIDAHTHLLLTGQSLRKVPLRDAPDLTTILERLRYAVRADPSVDRVFAAGWLQGALRGTAPTKGVLDAVVPDRPVYIDANDLHSMWVNSAALSELGIDQDTPDPLGGRIGRDPVTGEPDGMIYETATQQIARPYLASLLTDDDRDAQLEEAFAHYVAAGVTSVADMAVQPNDLAALERARARHHGRLPLRVKGYWLIHRRATEEENLAQVRRAVELAGKHCDEWLQMCGIKIIVDGVIDSCTAAMKEPYADGSECDPVWDRDALFPVVAAADATGLQVALHAIGDEASDIALDALEHANDLNGPMDRRHRLEHLESVTPDNIRRLAELDVVASIQPAHADPAIQDNWRAVLGDSRVDRAFPWAEMVEAGAPMAISTDAPTAPHDPLPNFFVATTRLSALDSTLPPNLPHQAIDLAHTLRFATAGAAHACRAETTQGRIEEGCWADFSVLRENPFEQEHHALLSNAVTLCVIAGEQVHPPSRRSVAE